MGDNTLVLGHRLSEWCGHAPVLEEDIALANTALDLIGQTQLWLGLAGEVEGADRDADRLAFHRDVWDFRNVLLVEQPNADFGRTIMRQYLFDLWHLSALQALRTSSHETIAAIAEKSVKEVTYHLERSRDLVIGLGDGTSESNRRMQAALDHLYPYVGEMFASDIADHELVSQGVGFEPSALRSGYDEELDVVLQAANLQKPNDTFAHQGGRTGAQHSEHLGHMLAQMQWLQRAYPDATW
ncbi:MAG: 1,2-phenylacetyl-CoA epoxidase subunit PaaC [Pseudomonadota bacterium]